MTDKTVKLLELIRSDKTSNEICLELGISNKQLYNYLTMLENKGLLFKREYYYNGVIKYKPINKVKERKRYLSANDNAIITSHSDNYFKCLVTSDLHFGNELERRDLLDKVYDYAANNGINVIFCCGDLIDGTYTKGKQKIESTYEQIEFFLKNYPFDKNILTFAVAGNHDISALNNGFQDIVEIVKNYRHDIVIGGYNNAYAHIKNDIVHLYHKVHGGKVMYRKAPIILRGHAHKYITDLTDKKVLNIYIPPLCDITESMPGFLELNLKFDKGYIKDVYIKQILMAQKPIIISEAEFNLHKERNLTNGNIKNEFILPEENLDINSSNNESLVLRKK